jgi:pyrroline-5-carboxylate reductase
MTQIAFLGAGAMGEALLSGLLAAQAYAPEEMVVYDANPARVQEIAARFGVGVAGDLADAARRAGVLLLAVKPQIVPQVLAELRDVLSPEHTLVSIAAGISTAQLESPLSQSVPVVRVMPNTPALVGKAASAICPGSHASAKHLQIAHRIFDAVGVAVDVEEKWMDAVTAVSGSGPAYVFLFLEALSDAGVKVGLPREIATRLAAQTVLGSAQMALETGEHPGVLKDKVTSPGGTTIAALHALESRAFRAAIYDAVEAAARRSRELGDS